MSEKLLDTINFPSDLRKLDVTQLSQVVKELRDFIIDIVSQKGGASRCKFRCGGVNGCFALRF